MELLTSPRRTTQKQTQARLRQAPTISNCRPCPTFVRRPSQPKRRRTTSAEHLRERVGPVKYSDIEIAGLVEELKAAQEEAHSAIDQGLLDAPRPLLRVLKVELLGQIRAVATHVRQLRQLLHEVMEKETDQAPLPTSCEPGAPQCLSRSNRSSGPKLGMTKADLHRHSASPPLLTRKRNCFR